MLNIYIYISELYVKYQKAIASIPYFETRCWNTPKLYTAVYTRTSHSVFSMLYVYKMFIKTKKYV